MAILPHLPEKPAQKSEEMKKSYRPTKTKIPGSDRPATYYIILAAKAFMAVLADEAEEACGRTDEFYYNELLHSYGEILDFLAENLELE